MAGRWFSLALRARPQRIGQMSDCEQQRAAMEPAASPVQSDDNPIVLVIDDDPDVREGLKALFQSVNLESRTYKSTPEFLRSKLPDQVSCLILDVRLPGLSGLDFQAELAKVNVNIPIIFITGFGDIPMSVKAMKAGAVEFLTKPIREQDLLDAVRAAIDRDRTRRKSEEKIQDLRTRFHALSAREQEVMSLVASGLMNKQVAAEIGIVEVTVKVHRHNIMKKLGAKSLAELVRMADALGLPRSDKTERPTRHSNHRDATG
jgi:FixJ family two-component response regulator